MSKINKPVTVDYRDSDYPIGAPSSYPEPAPPQTVIVELEANKLPITDVRFNRKTGKIEIVLDQELFYGKAYQGPTFHQDFIAAMIKSHAWRANHDRNRVSVSRSSQQDHRSQQAVKIDQEPTIRQSHKSAGVMGLKGRHHDS